LLYHDPHEGEEGTIEGLHKGRRGGKKEEQPDHFIFFLQAQLAGGGGGEQERGGKEKGGELNFSLFAVPGKGGKGPWGIFGGRGGILISIKKGGFWGGKKRCFFVQRGREKNGGRGKGGEKVNTDTNVPPKKYLCMAGRKGGGEVKKGEGKALRQILPDSCSNDKRKKEGRREREKGGGGQ